MYIKIANYQYTLSRLQTCWDSNDIDQWVKGGHQGWVKPGREETDYQGEVISFTYILVEDMKDNFQPFGVGHSKSTS